MKMHLNEPVYSYYITLHYTNHTMYKTNFVCTYKAFEEFEDDEVNSDMLYQAQFLQVFGLTDYNDVAINAGLKAIKAKAEELPELKALILKHPYNVAFTASAPITEPEINEHGETAVFDTLLTCLFAYSTMDVFHLCLIDAFKTGSILHQNQEKLLHAYTTL